MRTFCLRPSAENFERVRAEPAAKRLGPIYDAWTLAASFKFGEELGVESDTDRFIEFDGGLCHRAVHEPSMTLSMCVLYMFYGSGELKYIDLFYQCIGNHHLPTSTRVELSKEFKSTKSEYLEWLSDKTHPPLPDRVPIGSVDFSYFDGISTRAKERKIEHLQHPLAES